jgi:hypothetical protein
MDKGGCAKTQPPSTGTNLKIIGVLKMSLWNSAEGDRLFVFDLNAALIYPRKSTLDEAGNVMSGRISREPVYMESWRHQFGLPVEEHERTYAINRFDEYVVISVQTKPPQAQSRPQLERGE